MQWEAQRPAELISEKQVELGFFYILHDSKAHLFALKMLKNKVGFKEVSSITMVPDTSQNATQSDRKCSVSIRRINFGVPIP